MTTDVESLTEERTFLLRSLRDLEDERAAGDIEESDYEALKRDYTRRATEVIRALQEPEPSVTITETELSAERSYRTPVAVVVLVALALLAGWAVSSSSGDRTPGGNITGSAPGDVASTPTTVPGGVQDLLAQARAKFGQADPDVLGAIKLYDQVLKADPNQPEALAYRGWLLHLAGVDAQALASLTKAVEVDPSYPDAHFFRGEVLCTFSHDQAGAVAEFEKFLSADVPEEFSSLVENRLQSARSGRVRRWCGRLRSIAAGRGDPHYR